MVGCRARYDLVKEFVIAVLVVGALVVGLAAVFSSPDEKSLTVKAWAQADAQRLRRDRGLGTGGHERERESNT